MNHPARSRLPDDSAVQPHPFPTGRRVDVASSSPVADNLQARFARTSSIPMPDNGQALSATAVRWRFPPPNQGIGRNQIALPDSPRTRSSNVGPIDATATAPQRLPVLGTFSAALRSGSSDGVVPYCSHSESP